MLAAVEEKEVAIPEQIDALEKHMLQLPQVECPVLHHFGPGIYIREVTLPAGAVAIGHAQRYEQLNIMLTGKVAVIGDDGQVKILQAPLIFVGPPGRKIGYVVETTTWLNVYSTEERDIDLLEDMFLDKSDAWHEQQRGADEHAADREDFFSVVSEAGFTPEVVRQQSENEADQIDMPHGCGLKVTIRDSNIEGKGVFLSAPAEEGELIAPARVFGMRTPVGRYTNHSTKPNAKFVKSDTGDVFLVATRRISGCCGGDKGEEVTVDYRQALAISGIHLKHGEQA